MLLAIRTSRNGRFLTFKFAEISVWGLLGMVPRGILGPVCDPLAAV